MSKQLIESYKILIDSIFARSKGILGETFISKLIKKAEKKTGDKNGSLLKGIEYSQNELQLVMVYKNYSENEAKFTAEIIANSFNTVIDLINKALTMLVGKESSLKLLKDGLQDVKVKNKEIFEGEDFEKNLPKYII